MQSPTDIPLQRLLALLKASQLRALAFDLLTQPTPALESTAAVAPAQPATQATERYTYLDAAGNPLPVDQAHTQGAAVAVIQDNHTALQWSARPLAKGEKLTHPAALGAVAACTLLAGTDWQLPSIEQLHTVQDFTRHSPALKSPFVGRWPDEGWAWSRTDVADPDFAGYAWFVDLSHGVSNISHRVNHGVALACRPVPGASPRQ
jgi:hypothetical protein